jgi:hypothetical protein
VGITTETLVILKHPGLADNLKNQNILEFRLIAALEKNENLWFSDLMKMLVAPHQNGGCKQQRQNNNHCNQNHVR